MDINNLKAFIEVADKKSFSRSAESLKLTQPAVSKRIAALETELAAKLFDRVGRSVHLTEAGRLLLPSARQIRLELSRIEDVIFNLGNAVNGTLSIAICENIGTCHLPEIMKPYRQDYPNVDLDLRFADTHDTLSEVEEGQVELAMCSHPDSLKFSPKLRSAEIWAEEMVIVAANTHPLVTDQPTTGGKISLEKLSENQAVLPSSRTSTRYTIEDIMHASDHRTNVAVEAKDFETIRKMASTATLVL